MIDGFLTGCPFRGFQWAGLFSTHLRKGFRIEQGTGPIKVPAPCRPEPKMKSHIKKGCPQAGSHSYQAGIRVLYNAHIRLVRG